MTARSRFALPALVLMVVTAACGPKRVALPSGAGTPVADFRTPFESAAAACRGLRTLRATIALSGRAGGQRMRGTLIAGLEQPDSVRLEGVAPFGPPAFILAARAGSATLLLPRDNRAVTGVSAADILEALAGVRLDPPTLRAILSGCVSDNARPAAARAYNTDGPITIGLGTKGYPRKMWLAVDLGPGTTVYLRPQQDQWRIVAGRLPGLEVQYDQFESGLPRQIAIVSRTDEGAPSVPVDLSLALSDVSTNVTLSAAAFDVQVPRDAAPMTLAELRDSGPLGAKDAKGK